ncbi:MAG: LysR substrate-binding domain-containing protein, partial [Halocynthiibacter sp.]
ITVPAFQDIHSKALLSVHNITSLLAMVRADLGITILPEMTVKMAESQELAFIPLPDSPDDSLPERQIHMLRKADTPTSPAARELEQQIFQTVTELQSEALPCLAQ